MIFSHSKRKWKGMLLVWMDRKLAHWRNSVPQAMCAVLGGHEWGEWLPKASYNIIHQRTVHHTRECKACDKTEFFRASDDEMKAIEPAHRADLGW